MAKQQRCYRCDELTGLCEDDSLYKDGTGPYCEECYDMCEYCGHEERIDGERFCDGCKIKLMWSGVV